MSKKRGGQIVSPGCVVLDSEGFSRHLRQVKQFDEHLKRTREEDREFSISTLTLAEGVGGFRDRARLNYVRSKLYVVDSTEEDGLLAGELMEDSGKAGRKHTIDALVCAMAIRTRAKRIITSDPSDLLALLRGTGIEITPV